MLKKPIIENFSIDVAVLWTTCRMFSHDAFSATNINNSFLLVKNCGAFLCITLYNELEQIRGCVPNTNFSLNSDGS